jgi:A/G-specific adenine glycosylase
MKFKEISSSFLLLEPKAISGRASCRGEKAKRSRKNLNVKKINPKLRLVGKIKFDDISLRRWFSHHKRDLPWRDSPSPYAVWVSEVMLQQTQVSVVIPYFEKWMTLFPTIDSLAQSPLEDVIKAWEGLGYYSRARNLHAGAQYVVKHFNGTLPRSVSELRQIKGLGPYTIGAIRSFAFNERAAAVDGNVIRVLSRYYSIKEDISKPKTLTQLRSLTEEILPEKEPWVIMEALIELGAKVCTKKPKCTECPLKSSCVAFQNNEATTLPYKSTKVAITKLQRIVFVVNCGNHFLVKKGDKGKIMSDLYEFPYYESDEIPISAINSMAQKHFGFPCTYKTTLPIAKHSFTQYRVTLYPFLIATKKPHLSENYQWLTFDELKKLPFSSGHRRVFHSLQEHLL